MDYKEARALLEKYLAGNSSLEEEASLLIFFTENTDLPHDLRYAKAMFGHFNSDRKVRFQSVDRTPKRKIISIISSIAAGIIILLGVSVTFIVSRNDTPYVSWRGKTISVTNESAGIEKVLLSDNTVIWLNTDSRLIYPKNMKQANNTIIIYGEAFVEIPDSRNTNLNIIAHNALIETQSEASFNVRDLAEQESVEIAVRSGAVKVSEKGHAKGLAMLVTEGNYCSVHKYQKLIFAASNKSENYMAWKTGNLVFENSYMATVSEVLSRYYNVKINFEDKELAYCKFSGAFERKSIAYILEHIENELHFVIEQSGGNITLYGDGCQTN